MTKVMNEFRDLLHWTCFPRLTTSWNLLEGYVPLLKAFHCCHLIEMFQKWTNFCLFDPIPKKSYLVSLLYTYYLLFLLFFWQKSPTSFPYIHQNTTKPHLNCKFPDWATHFSIDRITFPPNFLPFTPFYDMTLKIQLKPTTISHLITQWSMII